MKHAIFHTHPNRQLLLAVEQGAVDIRGYEFNDWC